MAWKPAALAAAVVILAALPASAGAVVEPTAHSVDANVRIGSNYLRVTASSAATPLGAISISGLTSPASITGTVACMTVSGDEAFVVYRDVTSTARRNGTVGGYVRLRDNGLAGDEQNNGRFALRGLNRVIAAGCATPTSGAAFHPLRTVTEGAITVT